MKQIILLLLIGLFFNSCDKNKDEITYDYSFELQGDKDSDFAEQGELRTFTLTVFRETQINGAFSGQKEKVKASAITEIKLEGEQFTISNITKDNFICSFELRASENEEDTIRKGRIMFSIADGKEITYKTYSFQQKASPIEYQYIISTEMSQPFYIPVEGGKFEVSFMCNRLKSVNGELADTTPSALKSLRYNICRANSALVHSVHIEKDGESTGKYKFVIESSGKYNLTNWSAKNESTVFIEIKDGEEIIFHCDIIQPQTEGEDFSVPLVSSAAIGTFEI